MPQPDRGLTWLAPTTPTCAGYLRGLARGDIALSHDALHELPSWRTAAHLRDLLMACGALPDVDRQHPAVRAVATCASSPAHRPRPRCGCCASSPPGISCPGCAQPPAPDGSTTGARNHAAAQFTYAARLPRPGSPPGSATSPTTTQADIDAWHATHPRHYGNAPRLPELGRRHQATPATHHPCRTPDRRPADQPQHQRLALLRGVLTDDDHAAAHPGRRLPRAALRPARQPASPPHHRRRPPRRRPDPAPPRRPAQPRPRALRRPAQPAHQQPRQHEHRRQPRRPVAVPRRPPRPALTPGAPARTTPTSASPPPRPAPPPSANSSSKPPHPSSPKPSATARAPPTSISPAQPEPGTNTRRSATTSNLMAP